MINSVRPVNFSGNTTQVSADAQPKKSYSGRVIGGIGGVGAGLAIAYFAVPKAEGKSWPAILAGVVSGAIFAIGAYYDNKKVNQ